ncbi:hypothetical protein C5Y93_04850 [Blastopirellula marina]|uniref:Uncharacterized protein n=1 Tax=Blastopirellula marina TaxID=124 RepID=A0A2S8GTH9_9BACT|nr:hypothetical protein C5Y93_04850 [Blastopirellula marina]
MSAYLIFTLPHGQHFKPTRTLRTSSMQVFSDVTVMEKRRLTAESHLSPSTLTTVPKISGRDGEAHS